MPIINVIIVVSTLALGCLLAMLRLRVAAARATRQAHDDPEERAVHLQRDADRFFVTAMLLAICAVIATLFVVLSNLSFPLHPLPANAANAADVAAR